jgi:hypothetical protein
MDDEEMEPIFRAVSGGDVNEVARLLDAEPHLMEARDPDSNHYTPLMTAAGRAHVGLVTLLLERGADVNVGSEYGTTALHEAAAKGHEEVVSILLSHGADPGREDNTGTTPLLIASGRGHLGVVRQLLQVRGHVLDYRETALWYACVCGHVEVARALLLAKADHTIAAKMGLPRRRAAEEDGHTESVALLEVSSECIIIIFRRHQPLSPCSLYSWQWWEGELERGYVVHRARYLAEQHSLFQPTLAVAAAFLASNLASVAIPAFLSPRTRVVPVPHVEVVRLSEDEETGASTGQGKRKVEKEGGGDVQGPSEAERDATVKYVMQDLHPELYTELMAGFHPLRASV